MNKKKLDLLVQFRMVSRQQSIDIFNLRNSVEVKVKMNSSNKMQSTRVHRSI